MSHDLTEQALRDQLHAAAEGQTGTYVDVDPLAALDTAHRVLRRRRIAAVAGTAAAALAIGAGAWAALTEGTPDDRTLPAVTTSVTGPHADLPLGADPASGSADPLVAVVTADAASGKVEFRLRTETGTVLNAQVLSLNDGQASWSSLSDRVMAAVLPTEAAAFVPLWSVAVSQQEAAFERLPDGRVAAAWRTDVPATGTKFAGVVWTDGTSAFTAAGQPLSSVAVDDFVVFGNNHSGAMGYIRPEDGSLSGSGAVGQASEVGGPGKYPAVWAPDASGESGVYIAYLPPLGGEATKDITVQTVPEARVRDVTTYFPEGNVLLLVAHIDGPPDSVTGVDFPAAEGYPPFGG